MQFVNLIDRFLVDYTLSAAVDVIVMTTWLVVDVAFVFATVITFILNMRMLFAFSYRIPSTIVVNRSYVITP